MTMATCTKNSYYPLSVDHRFRAEQIFQIYWLAANLLLLLSSGLVHSLGFNSPRNQSYNLLFISICVAGACTGALSLALFFLSQKREENEADLVLKKGERPESSRKMLFEKALEDRGRENVLHSEFRRDFSGLWVFVDYPGQCYVALNFFHTKDPIWGVLCLLHIFLPGIAWHSRKELVSTKLSI